MQMNFSLPRFFAVLFVLCCPDFAMTQAAMSQAPSGTVAQPPQPATATPPSQQPETKPSAKERAPTSPPPDSGAHQSPREQAWQMLQTACTGDKASDRSIATLVLGLIPNNTQSSKLAEKALSDDKPEVRTAAAVALGEMKSRASIRKLRAATSDQDPSVVLAAAHSLDMMHDNSAYEVYYEVLIGERKAKKGLIATQTSIVHNPKKLAALGFEGGIGFVPFAGIGLGAIKMMTKDDTSPVRAAAAKVLAKDPDPATTNALSEAAGDKNWLVQVAALEALAKRGDPSALHVVEQYMTDEKAAVKYTAAATVVRLTAIQESKHRIPKKTSPKSTPTPATH